jgi:hypothetical protein
VTKLRLVALVLLLGSLALAGGCTSSQTVAEPEADFIELTPLIYDYGVVFDCATETITDEGFQVAKADRDSGTIETGNVKENEDRVRSVDVGHRVRAIVVKNGPKDFRVRFAATRIERTNEASKAVGEWHYVGKDAVLLEKLKKRFDQEVEKRYR